MNEVKGTGVIMMRRIVSVVVGTFLVGFLVWSQQLSAEAPAVETLVSRETPGVAHPAIKLEPTVDGSFAASAKSDPVGAFRAGLARYEARVHDYTCTFEKQERVGGQLTAKQVTRIRFRDTPFSVNMLWIENEGKARRVIYVEGRWNGKHGERLAVVEPAGSIARVFVSDVLRPIDGDEARAASRKPIDQFGFANTLRRILKICDLGESRKELDIKYVGEGMLAGRPTYMFERRLPYTNEGGRYPDRLLIVHLDKEYLLPTSCSSYGDEAKSELLGRYVLSDVRFNVGLADNDFARKGK